MNVLELYADVSKHGQLAEIFSVAAQQQKSGLPANFLEKLQDNINQAFR